MPRRLAENLLVALLFAVVTAFATSQLAQLFEPLLACDRAESAWFEADTTRVRNNLTARNGYYDRTSVHPLFVLATVPLIDALRDDLGWSATVAVRRWNAACAGLWAAAFFLWLVSLLKRRIDAALFTLLALVSASSLFFVAVPETHILGSLSIIIALAATAWTSLTPLAIATYLTAIVLTFAFTITNWMAAIAATFSALPWRKAAMINVVGLALITGLWLTQRMMFPTISEFFNFRQETRWVLTKWMGGPQHALVAFVVDTMVAPQSFTDPPKNPLRWTRVLMQLSTPGSATPWGWLAVALWLALLALGTLAVIRLFRSHPTYRAITLTLLGQLAMHLVYGDETFVYSLHFLPLLIGIAAAATTTRFRALALVLVAALILAAGSNNARELDRSLNQLGEIATRETCRIGS